MSGREPPTPDEAPAPPSGAEPTGPAPGEPEPFAIVLTRGLGGVVVAAAALLLLSWFVLPLAGLGEGRSSLTLAQATQGSYEDTGVALQCLLAIVLGLAGVLRPALGPGIVALAALPLPWALRFNVLALGAERPAVLVLLTTSATVLALAAAVAVVVAGRHAWRTDLRPTPRQGLAWGIGVGGLAATAGLGWYRLLPLGAVVPPIASRLDLTPQGGVLGIGGWPGRGSTLGLVLAGAALAVTVVSPRPVRRAGGWALVAVLVTEAVRRGVLPAEDLSPFLVPDVITIELLALGLLVPLIGAAAGAWMALAPDEEVEPGVALGGTDGPGRGPEPVGDPADLPVRPPAGPPAAWPAEGGA